MFSLNKNDVGYDDGSDDGRGDGEYQYLNLILRIFSSGIEEEGRNGLTKSIFGYNMRFSLRDGVLPILTTKYVNWKMCFNELKWFLSGSTDVGRLQDLGVNIWNANATREFLDSRGLQHLPVGCIGAGYGHQWRNYGGKYDAGWDIGCCGGGGGGDGIDQIAQLIAALKDPAQHTSRRLILTAWNPCQLDEMALPPCHVLAQFRVYSGKYLSCSLYQRSGDVGLGVPYNIASYSLLTHLLAHHCGLKADGFYYTIGDAHIYKEHEAALNEQTFRVPYQCPQIKIENVRENIEDYVVDDLIFVREYQSHGKLNMKMIA